MMGRKHPQSLLDEAVRDYLESGQSIRAVADRHGMSHDSLRIELRRLDVTRTGGGSLPQAVRDAALSDFLDGMTIAQVATKHGISRSVVSSWLQKAGLSARDREDGESPFDYRGGWQLVGGVRRPLAPVRGVA